MKFELSDNFGRDIMDFVVKLEQLVSYQAVFEAVVQADIANGLCIGNFDRANAVQYGLRAWWQREVPGLELKRREVLRIGSRFKGSQVSSGHRFLDQVLTRAFS